MSRVLRVAAAVVVLVGILLFVGFRLWLSRQPSETRIAVEAFTFLEFAVVVRDHFSPRPIADNASFGRREYPGRGHSPWVMRSSLDGRPRMLSLSLAPELWLAYSTETASIHQLWRGDIDFSGPAFDARHGAEPMSRGRAFLRAPAATAWRVKEGDAWVPATVRWRGHGVDPRSGAAWLGFDVVDASGRSRTVLEWPDHVEPSPESEDGVSQGEGWTPGRLGFVRSFDVDAAVGPAIAVVVGTEADAIETDGKPLRDGLLLVGAGRTQLTQWFAEPTLPIESKFEGKLDAGAFAALDCGTCHNPRERVVGPAWSEISHRYAGANRRVTAVQLAMRIREGSVGRWGPVAMAAHPQLTQEQSEELALLILATEPAELARPVRSSAGESVTSTYDYDVEERPKALHPSLSSMPIDSPGFRPQVGGLAWLPDGRLLVATWDRDGAVFAIDGWDGPLSGLRIQRIAEGLHEPLGIATQGEDVYVIQKQEITRLIDHDGDGWTDEYRTLSNDWRATSNFHEFGFGLVPLSGFLYGSLSVCVLQGGKSCREQTPDRGKVFRVSLSTGEAEFVASGFRTPNGLAPTPEGDLLVTDNQGDWLPASKLMRVEPGDDYGWRPPGEVPDPQEVTPPALWLPHNEVGNSPTQPVVLTQGPYAGHVLFGDIFNGGIKRGFLEEVRGRLQGAAFHFSGGLRAPVNRLIEAPRGGLVAGQVGSRGNWGESGKPWFGLELLRFGKVQAFEPIRVEVRREGFDVTFGGALDRAVEVTPGSFRLQDWYYVPSEIYGGPKYDVRDLLVRAVRVSSDRRVVSIDVDGLAEGRVVYLWMDRSLRSEAGESLWVNEAWYTLNVLPDGSRTQVASTTPVASSARPVEEKPPDVSEGPAPNTLTAEERAAGWRLLFDGESFASWKIYGAQSDEIEGWVIRDAAFEFTRDVSFAGLVWNHINPFSRAALDLMTKERFANFELSIDWKVTAGGNSGIFYLVPNEEASLSWAYGLEMQVLDDARHSDGRLEKRRAGDLYDVVASTTRPVRPAGEWNTARIRVAGGRIEHWLNGEKVIGIDRYSPEWDRAIADSKHADVEGYGLARRGHIVLQDHGDVVWYRNIKIRRLGG
ncbi:MAG: hypothetical protein CL908_19840 [Deltaproteobacteria bacterium]|nr:hypothetical protein [Deltaproteobacteria bacterium]